MTGVLNRRQQLVQDLRDGAARMENQLTEHDQTPPGAIVSTPPSSGTQRSATDRPRPEAQATPPAIDGPTPMAHPRAGSIHGSSHIADALQEGDAAAALPAAGQDTGVAQTVFASGATRPAADVAPPQSGDVLDGLWSGPPAPAKQAAPPEDQAPVLVDPLLILSAQALDDLEATRIANENRLRSLRDVYGLAGSSQEAEAAGLVDGLAKLEHQAELSLKRALRRHPLGPWVKRTVGVGEKQGARLLAAIGDPYWHPLHERPRLVSELWAYCGYHVLRAGGDLGQVRVGTHHAAAGVAPARARGQRANWNADAKSRVWLIACSCIKQATSPYRAVYDGGRERYAEALHQVECRRCGPSGHPAATGTPLSAGHQHARALRLVSKAILRDLWAEARELHNDN